MSRSERVEVEVHHFLHTQFDLGSRAFGGHFLGEY